MTDLDTRPDLADDDRALADTGEETFCRIPDVARRLRDTRG
jgi:hypothetical protein